LAAAAAAARDTLLFWREEDLVSCERVLLLASFIGSSDDDDKQCDIGDGTNASALLMATPLSSASRQAATTIFRRIILDLLFFGIKFGFGSIFSILRGN
jgi:hypothetical protein